MNFSLLNPFAIFKNNLELLRFLIKRKTSFIGLIIISITFLTSITAPWISPHDPIYVDMSHMLESPSSSHLLGTDVLGRDILSRMIWGSRISLQVSIISVSTGLFIGLFFGLLSGYYSGSVDYVIMRVVDVLLSFPSLILALAISAMRGPSISNTILALSVAMSPRYTRLIRSIVLSIRENDYIAAAKTSGTRNINIILRHVLPNAAPPIIVQATLSLASATLAEAGLSFLGVGIRPPTPSWGNMISDGRAYLRIAPWISVFPGFAVMLLVFGFNLFGEGLRDFMDPKIRNI
jgi:peptide/nickel transport system permease protein